LPLLNYTSSASDIHKEAISQDGAKFLPPGTPSEVVKGYKQQQKVLNDKLLDTNSAILEVIWSDGAAILGLQHPYSRGSVKATSSNIFDSPEANPELLKNPLDVALLVEGVRFARKLSGTPSIKTLGPFEVLPGANVTSDSDIEDFVRSSASTLFHPAGSCKIGTRSEGGVVDQKLRVHGISGLRIVDASIMPLLPATHTMTTVYAMAEKVSVSSTSARTLLTVLGCGPDQAGLTEFSILFVNLATLVTDNSRLWMPLFLFFLQILDLKYICSSVPVVSSHSPWLHQLNDI
jgi:hypothetical protein